MSGMRAFQIRSANGAFERVERLIPQPPARHVRIKVQACGVCHSDVFTKEGGWPGIQYPRVPGHEIAGIIALKQRAQYCWLCMLFCDDLISSGEFFTEKRI